MVEQAPGTEPLPLVGRARELGEIMSIVREIEEGDGELTSLLLRGPSGVGKSRVGRELADRVASRGWTVARGQAFPVESGIAHGLLREMLHPLLADLSEERLQLFTRGAVAQLSPLIPWMDTPEPVAQAAGSSAEARARTHWTVAGVLRRLGREAPLLLFADDLEWADASSLEGIHFLARQLQGARVLLLGCIADDRVRDNPGLDDAVLSLERAGVLRSITLGPLGRGDVAQLVEEHFAVSAELTGAFSRRLWERTGGNPFFVGETLGFLMDEGHLRRTDGGWLGWETASFDDPAPTIEESILRRMARLSGQGRQVLETAAVLGTRADVDLLREASGLEPGDFGAAVEELCDSGFLSQEEPTRGRLELRFNHSLVRDAVEHGMSTLIRRNHHLRVLDLLRARKGGAQGTEDLAAHLLQLSPSALTAEDRSVLADAGRAALDRGADREAVRYLRAALPAGDGTEAEATRPDADPAVMADLARGLRRLGLWDEATALQEAVLARLAHDRGPLHAQIEMCRQLCLTRLAAGRPDEAVQRSQGMANGGPPDVEAEPTPDEDQERPALPLARAGLHLARAAAHHQLGDVDAGRAEAHAALDLARELADPHLLARVHRVLTLSHLWTGDHEKAREHGHQALAAADESGNQEVAGRVHWVLAVVAGLTGRSDEVARHLDACRQVADDLSSPSLRLAWLDIEVERAAGVGEWAEGVALGEQAIDLALALDRRSVLPRLMTWTGLLHLGRGRLQRARELVDEAWTRAGADQRTGRELATDLHSLIPAHLGRAQVHLHAGEYDEAVRYATDGLAIADAAGYRPWALHRLLPTLAEAYLWLGDLDGARQVGERIRREARVLDHPLGMAWADACEALTVWLSGDIREGAVLMRQAVEALEAIPMIPDAARLRRQLAGRLAEAGEIDAARDELEQAYETFVRLGMEAELEKARAQFRELGARPPSRSLFEGADGLTSREMEIIQHVARRRSNKAIGKALSISPRTVSTHLSNIYRKVEVGGRGELTDLARAEGWVEGTPAS